MLAKDSNLIIIGAGMGGLSAAIWARVAGYRVTILEKNAKPGGKAAGIELSGYQLDPGPSIIILPEIYERLFAAASRTMDDYLRFEPLKVLSRVFFEGEPAWDIPAGESACIELLRSMSSRDAAAFERLMDKLGRAAKHLDATVFRGPIESPIQLLQPGLLRFGMAFNPMRNYREMVDGMFQLPIMRAFFYGFPSYGGQSYTAKAPGAFMIPFFMFRKGVFAPVGGVRAIPQALHRLAEELGVEFRFETEIIKCHGAGSQMESVTLSSEETLKGDAFVSNMDRFSFDRLRGIAHTMEPSYSYVTIHWGVRNEFPDLEHHNLFVPRSFESGFRELYDQNRFPAEPIIYLNAPKQADPDSAPTGSSSLFAVVTIPSQPQDVNWAVDGPRLAAAIRSALGQYGVAWSDSDQDFELIQTPLTFAERDGNYGGSLYGVTEKHRLMGMFPWSNRDPQWKNLAFCGGSVQPGAGLPMAALSGQFAVNLLR